MSSLWNVMYHTVSALVPNPVWAWPLTRLLRWSPADSEDRESPYALCLHATLSLQPHETLCQPAFMSPGWSQHHTETVSVSLAVCARISGCIRHSAGFQGPCSRYNVNIWQGWTKWRKQTVCPQVSLIRQSFCAVTTLKYPAATVCVSSWVEPWHLWKNCSCKSQVWVQREVIHTHFIKRNSNKSWSKTSILTSKSGDARKISSIVPRK